MTTYVPSEENLAKIIAGEIEDFAVTMSGKDLARSLAEKKCPRDGRALSTRDNPRHPGLNLELYCSCGFAGTT